MGCKAFQLTGYKVLCNDTAGTSLHENNVLHFIACKQFYSTYVYLSAQWELEVVVTETGYDILTVSKGMPEPPTWVKGWKKPSFD